MTMHRAAAVLLAGAVATSACGGSEAQSGPIDAAASPASTEPEPPATTSAPTTTPETTAPPTTSPSSTTPNTTAPTTTVAVPTTAPEPATPLEDALGGTPNLGGWLVEPGRYSTARLGTPIEFVFDEAVTWFDGTNLIIFGRDDLSGDQRALIFLVEPVGIIPAAEVGTHPPHDPTVPANTEEMPNAFGDWLEAVAQLDVVGSGEAATGEGPASYWDVAVDVAGGDTFSCHLGDCVANIVVAELGAFVFGDDLQFRIYQLTGAADGLLAFVQAQPTQFDDTVALADGILRGMTIGG